jgi:hypothetical protein
MKSIKKPVTFPRRPVPGTVVATVFRFHGTRFAAAACLLLLLSLSARLHAQPANQPASTNRVLELDGTGGYVELPPNIFNDLDEATVEAWVRWDDFSGAPKHVFNYGGALQDMTITSEQPSQRDSATLGFAVCDGQQRIVHWLEVPSILRAQKWCHVAAVSGKGGMKLYLNGALVGTNDHPGSFAGLKNGSRFYFGQTVTTNNLPVLFKGAMDEVRVWKVARTEAQIREAMLRRLTGDEPELAGLWNFDNVDNRVVKDSTPGAHHGKLLGSAKVIAEDTPASVTPANISHVLELDGTNSWVELPPYIFTNLTEATVEGWVKWRRLAAWSRFFDLGISVEGQELDITQDGESDALKVELGTRTGEAKTIVVPSALRTNEWQHYALVLGKAETVLYLNGVRVGAADAAGLQIISRNGRATLGHNLWTDLPRLAGALPDFQGQMDEVRVWKVARTEAQIRETMFQHLSGNEPELAALWNFDNVENGVVKDSTGSAHEAKLVGKAKIVAAQLPGSTEAPPLGNVLQLDGTNSFVEFPSGAFSNLTVATIEGWVRWERFANMSRFFDFAVGGLTFDIQNRFRSSNLWLERGGVGFVDIIEVPAVLSTGRWTHVAAVVGPETLKLFLNGVLLSTNGTRAVFNTADVEKRNFLGRSNWRARPGNEDEDFRGQIGEVRVWQGKRSQAQIRETMFQHLTGKEPGLVGLWNFENVENGIVKDASPGAHDGQLQGAARVVPAAVSAPGELVYPSSFTGNISDANGRPIAGATVQIIRNGINQQQAVTDANGDYTLGGVYVGESYDVSVVKGELGAWRLGVKAQAGQVTRLDIQLGSNTVSGSLLALDGSPHVNTVVQAVAAVSTPSGSTREDVVATERSDARGNYRFVNLRPGAYRLRSPGLSGYAYYEDLKTVTVESGKPLAGLDLRFAPQKKGSWETYDVVRGLADNNQIRKILFDPDGSVWFATAGGASRFDGQEFINFTTHDGLPDDDVLNMARDAKGDLWFSTDTGIARYDGRQIVKWTAADGVPTRFIDAIYATPDGKMWFGSGFAPWVFSFDGKKFAYFTTTNGLTAPVRKMAGGRNGIIWMAGRGLLRFDGTNFVNCRGASKPGQV